MPTDDEKRYRASEAERLLNEPLLKEAFDELERSNIEQMLAVGSVAISEDDDRKRRALAERVNAIRDVRTKLHAMISEGKHVATKVDRYA